MKNDADQVLNAVGNLVVDFQVEKAKVVTLERKVQRLEEMLGIIQRALLTTPVKAGSSGLPGRDKVA